MFKNLIVYRLAAGWDMPLDELDRALQGAVFAPCGATQALSVGWVPPRGEAHAALVESVQGQWLLRLRTEQKLLPSAVVKERAQDMAEQIEHTTGRRPGKKEMRDLREQATQELLPLAFSRHAAVGVWIDRAAGLLVLDTTSAARAEDAVTLLVQCLPQFAVQALHTAQAPSTAMADWLVSGEPPAGFTVDRDCELKAADESRAAVRYARHALDIDEIRAHIEAGKRPTRLALTWSSRIGLVLTDALQVRRIAFEDVVFEAAGQSGQEADFDADMALMTGELSAMLRDLVAALGGWGEEGAGLASPAAAASEAPAVAAAPVPPTGEPAQPTAQEAFRPPWED